MARVSFYRGLEAYYSVEKYQDALYFCTDTKKIIMNNISYGFDPNDKDIDIISLVEWVSPDTIKFGTTNGKEVLLRIPTATKTEDGYYTGLMSATDKEILDNVPNVYATKEELNQKVVGVYHFKGVVNEFKDLPLDNLSNGDTYKVIQAFDTEEGHFAEGTHVVWNGTNWVPMEGESGYSREEADAKFVPWTEDASANKLIILPKGSKLIGTQSNDDGANLVQLGIYQTESGVLEQTEIGSAKVHLTLNSSDRPSLDLPNGAKEDMAYLSDTKLNVYNLGNIESFNNLAVKASEEGVWNNIENSILTFSIDNSSDHESGTIINMYASDKAYQRLYWKGNIWTRTVTQSNDTTSFYKEEDSDKVYYPGVKVDALKLFALTTNSTDTEIQEALTIALTSGRSTLPTAEILDECISKGFLLNSMWMPVSVTWNGTAYVFYMVGQTYMNQPNSVAQVAIRITDGVYSVFQKGTVKELVFKSDIELIPRVINFPLRTLQDKVYTQEEILGWFGVSDTAELRSIISSGGIQYVKYGIILNTPRYYKMPVEYTAFESATQIKLVFNGLDTRDDTPCKYEIIINLDGTIIDGNSNVKLTLTSTDVAEALQWTDVTE